jgi:hypothetical protein
VLCEDVKGVLSVIFSATLVVDSAGFLNCVLVNRLLAGRTGSSSSDEIRSITVGITVAGRFVPWVFCWAIDASRDDTGGVVICDIAGRAIERAKLPLESVALGGSSLISTISTSSSSSSKSSS